MHPKSLFTGIAMAVALYMVTHAAWAAAKKSVSGSTFSAAQLSAAQQLRERALGGTGAYGLVASLTTEVGPRFAGSPGDRAAVAWAVSKLKALGFQNVRTQEVKVPHWERGSLEVAITSPWPQPLVATALGGSVGTGDEGIEAEVVEAKDIEALKALPRERVQGRIVFMNTRTARTRDAQGYVDAVPSRSRAAGAAAALGAVAVVIRSIGTDSDRLAHAGGTRYAPEGPRIPAAALSNPDADLLERQLSGQEPVRLRVKMSSRELPEETSANVIGEIPGMGETARQIVLLGAHLDSWDLGTGALDDGAGVAIVMEAARLIKDMGLAPKRTLRVVLFTNEEFGSSGNKAYAEQIAAEIDNHFVAMEADLGQGPVWRFDTHVAEGALPLADAFIEALRPLGIERGNNETTGGVDLGPLLERGVPVFDLLHDATDYFDYHHTANDTLDKVDAKILDKTVAAYVVTAWLAASIEGDLGRAPEIDKK